MAGLPAGRLGRRRGAATAVAAGIAAALALAAGGPGAGAARAGAATGAAPAASSAVAAPGASLAGSARAIRRGLARAVSAGRLSPADAAPHRAALARAVRLAPTLPPLRTAAIETLVADVAGAAALYDRPRALTLFSALAVNAERLAAGRVPAAGTDVTDAEGVVYRWFTGRGYRFHPLANFAALNNHVSGGRQEEAARLAAALVQRGVPARKGLVWEYWFPFGSGRPPWVSGMAQAVAAQALARAQDATGDPALRTAAQSAFRAAARLVLRLPEGPWIRLYSFTGEAVLNAQLQAAVSLREYGERVGDPSALLLSGRLGETAAALLPRFDTGAWSRYALRGEEADAGYHRYVVGLLARLGRETGDPRWQQASARFAAYEQEPPVLLPGAGVPAAFPVPADGHRDSVVVRFRVSKRSQVSLVVDGKAVAGDSFAGGMAEFRWFPGAAAAPGLHEARVVARAANGLAAEMTLPPLEVRHVRRAPDVTARVDGRWLAWRTDDEGIAWLDLRLVLRQGSRVLVAGLGRRGLSGALRLPVPPGTWRAELVATSATGKGRRVPLGTVTRPG